MTIAAFLALAGSLPAAATDGSTAAVAATLPAGSPGTWSSFEVVPGMSHATAIYDPSRHRMIVVGGNRASSHGGDPWVYSLESGSERWFRLSTSGPEPTGLRGEAVVLDPAGRRIVQFGGVRDREPTDELWVLSYAEADGIWERFEPGAPWPFPRASASAAWDTRRNRMLVFGGVQSDTAVWALSLDAGPAWSVLETAGESGPPPGVEYVSTYDSVGDRLILHGAPDGETWVLALEGTPRWRKLDPPERVRVLGRRLFFFDVARNRPLLVTPTLFGGEFLFELSIEEERWIPLRPAVEGPRFVDFFCGIHEPMENRILLFGGWNSAGMDRNDLWSYDLESTLRWSRVEFAPAPRTEHALVYDALQDRLLVHGGVTGQDALSGRRFLDPSVWALDLVSEPRWSVVRSGLGLAGFPLVLDPERERFVGVGGHGFTSTGCPGGGSLPSYLGGAWSFPLSPDGGVERLPSGGQTDHFSLIRDPIGDRLITFGGSSLVSEGCIHQGVRVRVDYHDDLATLPLDGTGGWQPLSATGEAPPAQGAHFGVYDEDRHRMVIVGGVGPDGSLRETVWTLTLGERPHWSRHSPSGEPPNLDTRGAIYDPARERVVVFGPRTPQEHGVWALSLRDDLHWSPVPTEGTPPEPRYETATVYDTRRDRMIVFGGANAVGTANADTWFLTWGDPLRRVPLAASQERGLTRGDGTSRGWVRLAILSTRSFDARSVDPSTIAIFEVRPFADDPDAVRIEERDFDHDGLVDLVLRLRRDQIEIRSDFPALRIDARTWNGLRVRGLLPGLEAPGPRRGAPASLASPVRPEFALEGATPNPGLRGRLEVAVRIAGDGPAILEVFDVAGRRAARKTLEASAGGRHLVQFGTEIPLAPGAYVLRLRQGDRVESRRAVVLR